MAYTPNARVTKDMLAAGLAELQAWFGRGLSDTSARATRRPGRLASRLPGDEGARTRIARTAPS
jgi:hypothetical protein